MPRLGLLVLFAAGTLAAPFMVLDEHLPRAQLKDDGCSNLRFPPKGEKFTYDYAGSTLSVVAGSSERKTGMQITAEISIAAVSKCSFVLEVSKAELTSKSASDDQFTKTPAENLKFKQEIEKFGLRFDLGANGEVESLVSHALEPTHILNMKRGIVSQLQLDVNGQVETDVNGICDMEIQNAVGKIIKTKDLSKCSKRAVNEIGLQSTSVQSESNMKPLASTSKCTYEVTSTSIKTVSCEETHMFRPFSAGYKSPSGAITTVKQTLKNQKSGRITGKINLSALTVSSTLAFDHEKENFSAANTITKQVDAIMAALVQKTEGGYIAQQNSAREFQNLVTVLRKMDEKRLTPVYTQYIDCIKSGFCKPEQTNLRDVYRQFLLDAVTYCGTPTCISMIRDVIINGQISGERMNMFLQGIALVGKTDVNMVRDVLMIAKKTPSRQAFLTLGTLIFRQCSKNEQDCHYDATSPISQAESFLEEILGKGCEKQTNHEDLEQILMALKAIGNAGRPISAFKKVLNCGINSQHGNLTVAAFDALRRMPCDHKRSERILAFVSDEDACPEKRSHAFKALVKCPDEQILHKLIHRLDQEPSKQLGSFMWTTLTNIMESSDSKHALCQKYLENILQGKPLKEVNMPMHQFSKNYEKSFNLNKLDTGLTAEGDLIFNPEGYLPRSAFFNLTANVMGVPVHVVEASAQVNGMETLLEDVFGPDGMFPDNTVFKIFNFTLTKEKLMDMANKRNERMDNEVNNRRTRRSAKNTIEENLKDLHKRVNNKRDVPSGSLSFKVMGQEIRAFSYDDLFWAIDKIDNMNVITMLLNVAKGGKKTFSKSMLFLEMTHSVPTGLGLPLKLKLVGSTVSSIELDGKFDIRNMFWGPSSMTIKGSVKPSASVEVTGQMGVYSQFVDTGLYVSNTMHTSQFLKGSVVYKQGQMLKVNLDTPDEPVQLFNFSSTPFMFTNEKSVLIEGAERKINPDFCTKSVILGFGVCTSLRIPVAYRDYEAPYYPLSGPSHFGMKLVKADAKLTTYEFLAKLSKKGDVTKGELSLSTPGASYERKIEGDMTYSVDGSLHTMTIGSSNALGSSGKRTEVEASYDTVSHSVKIGAKSDLLTPSFVTYDFSLFNETNPAGRAFGVRSTVAYDKYKYTAESKVVKTKTGGLLMSSINYYPGKAITGTLEFNSLSNKVFARFDADQFKQLAVDISGQYIRRGSYRGLVLTGQHVMSGKKASLAGGLDDGKLILTGDLNGNSAKTVITVTGKKVGVSVEAVGNKAELAATLDSKQFAKILALTAIVNGKGAKLTTTVDYKSDKTITIDADVLGKKASSTVGLYTPGEDIILKASVTAAGQTASTAAGYYVKQGKKTWKWEGDAIGHHFELYSNYLITENKIVDMGAVFDKYVAGLRSVYSTKKGNSLCSSMYYSIGKAEVEPFIGCIRYVDFAHDHNYVHKELILTADMNTIKQNLEAKVVLEQHPGHSVVKSTFSVNGQEKCFSTLDSTYGDVKNSETKLTIGTGKKTMSVAVFSKPEGKDTQKFGIKYQVLDKTLAFISKLISKDKDWTVKNLIVVNGKALPVSNSLRYFQGPTGGTELTMTVKDISLVYLSTFKNGIPDKVMGASLSLNKAGKQIVSVYKNSIVTWSQKEKSLEQQFGMMIKGEKYQYGYTIQVLDKSSSSKSAVSVGIKVAYSTTKCSSITLLFANGKQTTEFHADIEYLHGKHLKQIVIFNKQDKKLDISFELLPQMFVKYSAKLNKLQGFKLNHDLSLQLANAKNAVKKGYTKSVQWVNKYVKSAKKLKLSTNVGKHVDVSFENKDDSSIASVRIMTTKAEFITTYIPARNGIVFRFLLNDEEQLAATAEMKNGKAALALSRGKTEVEFLGFYVQEQNKLSMNINLNKKTIIGFSLKKSGNSLSYKVITAGSTVEIVGKQEGLGLFLKFNLNEKMIVQFAAQVDAKSKTLTLSSDTGKQICGLKMRADWVNLIAGSEIFCNKHVTGWEAAIKGKSLTLEFTITPTKSVVVTFELEADNLIKITVTRKFGDNKVDEFTTTIKLTPEMFKLAFNLNKETINNLTKKIIGAVDATQKKVRKISRRSVDAAMEQVKDLKNIKVQEKATEVVATLEDLITEFLTKMDLKEMITKARAATKKSLEEASKTLKELKDRMPEISKQIQALLKTLKKNIQSQIDSFDMSSIKDIQKIAQEKLKELAKYNKVLANKVQVLATQLKKIAKGIAKSSRPVIAKAIKLAKDFKIRGKTLQSIAKLIIKKGEQYTAVIVKLTKGELETLTKEGQKLIQSGKVFAKQGTAYVMKLKLPLSGGRTTEQCIEIIVKKFNELRAQLDTVELNKLITKVQTIVQASMDQNIKELTKELKKLPGIAREALKSSIKISRGYLKDLQKYKKLVVKYEKLSKKALNQAIKTLKEMGIEVEKSLKPITNYITVVSKSVQKNFGPLAKKVALKINNLMENINLDPMTLKPIVLKQLRVIETMLLPLVKPIAPLYNKIMLQIRQMKILGVKIGPMFDMKLKELQASLDKYVQESGSEMTKILGDLYKAVEKVGKMSPEQIVDIAFDQLDKVAAKLVKQVQTAFKQRKVIMEKTLAKAMELYKQLKDLTLNLNEKSAKTALNILFKESGKLLTKTSDELKNLADQLAKLDLVNPTKKAFTDIIGELKSMKINKKIIAAIEAARKIDPTKKILEIVKELEEKFVELKEAAIVKAMLVYQKAQKAQQYIKSIPKKTYEEWFQELQKFVEDNKLEIINYFQTMYGVTKDQAEKIFATFNSLKLNNVDYEKVMKEYVEPVKKMGEEIVERGRRVRREIEQPTMELKDLYAGKVSKFGNDKYQMIFTKVTELLAKLKLIIENNYEAVSKDVIKAYVEITGKVVDKVEMVYAKFMKTYGNQTWEQIGEQIYKSGETKVQEAKKTIIAKIQYLMHMKEKLEEIIRSYSTKAYTKATVIYKDLEKKSIVLYKDLVKKAQAKYAQLKPKIVRAIKMITTEGRKLKAIVIKKIQQLKKTIEETIKQYKQLAILGKTMVIDMYQMNKQKTLREAYTELKAMATSIAMAQYEMIKPQVMAKVAQIKTKVAELKAIYKKYAAKVQNKVLPEIKGELISITNQLVKGYAELTKEITIQFAPQITAVRVEVMKVVKIVKTKIAELKAFVEPLIAADYQQMKKDIEIMAKTKYNQLVAYVKQLIAQLKQKYDNLDMIKIKKLQAKVDELVKLAKEKFAEIQKNPRIQNLRKLAVEKLNEVKLKLKELKNNPALIKTKKQLEAKIARLEKQAQRYKTQALAEYKKAIKEYKLKINEIRTNPTFVKAMKTLTKLQKSADFTVSKLAQKITPLLKKLIKDLTLLIESAPATCTKAYEQFKANPEKTFWTAVDKVSKQSKVVIAEARKLKSFNVKKALKNGQAAFIQLADECTDDYAKNTAKLVVKQTKQAAKNVKQTLKRVRREAPEMAKKYVKKAAKEATQAMKQLKENAQVVYDKALKPIVDNQIWGEIVDEIKSHEITQLVQKLIKLIKKGAEIVAKETKIIYNQVSTKAIALWNENFPKIQKKLDELKMKFDEAKKQLITIVVQKFDDIKRQVIGIWNAKFPVMAKKFDEIKKQLIAIYEDKFPVVMKKFNQIKQLSIVKFTQLKKLALKTIADLKIQFNTIKEELMKFDIEKTMALLEKKLEELKKIVLAKVEELKKTVPAKVEELKKIVLANVEQLKKQTIALYEKSMKEFNKFLDTTKLVDIENFVRKTIAQTKKVISQVKAKLVYLKDNYKQLAQKYYSKMVVVAQEYKDQAVKTAIALIKKYKPIVLSLVKKYKTEALKMVAVYKKMGESAIKELKVQYIKYKALVVASLKEYTDAATKMFNEYKTKAIAIFTQYKAKAIAMFNAYKTKVIVLLNKLKVIVQKYQAEALKTINLYKTQVLALYNKYKPIVMNFITDYQNQIKKMIATYKPKVLAFVNKYKTQAIALYNKYQPIVIAQLLKYKTEAIKQFNLLKSQTIKLYNTYKPKFVAKYEECMEKITAQALNMYITYKPKVVAALKRVQELVIMYKVEAVKIYNTLLKDAKKMIAIYKPKVLALINKYKAQIIALYNKYTPIVIAQLKKYKTEATALFNEYKSKANKVIAIYKPKIEALIKKAKAIFNEYKSITEAYINKVIKPAVMKLKAQIDKLVLKAKTEADKLIKIYKPKVLALIKKIKALVLAKYNTVIAPLVKKYTPMIKECTDKIVRIVDMCKKEVIAAYKVYSEKVLAQLNKVKALYNKYKPIVINFINDYENQIKKMITTYKPKVLALIKDAKTQVIALYKKYKPIVINFIKDYEPIVIKAIDYLKNNPKKAIVFAMEFSMDIIGKQVAKLNVIIKDLREQYTAEIKAVIDDLKVRWTKCMSACQKELEALIKLVNAKLVVIKAKALEIKSLVEKTIKNPEPLKKLILAKAMQIKAQMEKLMKIVLAKAVEIKSMVEKKIATINVEKVIKDLTLKAMELKAKAEKIVMDLKPKVEKLAMELKAKAEKFAKVLKASVEKCIEKCTTKAQVYIKDLKAKALKIKLQAEKQIAILKIKIEKIIADLIKKAIELKSKAIKTWQTSSVRKGLVTLKGMTISETIVEIKNMYAKMSAVVKTLPAKAQKIVIAEFNRIRAIVEAEFTKRYGKAIELYKEMYAKALSIYKERYAQAIALYNRMSSKAMAAYKKEYERVLVAYKKAILKFQLLKKKVIAKLTMLKNEITTAAMPYYKQVKKATLLATNEVKEAAIFAYKYYNVQKTIEMIQDKIENKIKNLKPVVRKAIIEFYVMLKKMLEEFKIQAEELFTIYKKQGMTNMAEYKKFALRSLKKNFQSAKVNGVKLAKKTGHTMLRGVHSGLVAIDNIDTTKLKRTVRSIISKTNRQARSIVNNIHQYVDLDTTDMYLRVNIPLSGSLKTTLTKNIKQLTRKVKTLNIRARRAVKVAKKEMIKQVDRVQRTVESVRRKALQSKLVKDARQAVEEAQITAAVIKKQVAHKTSIVYKKLMRETTGIRRDLAMVFKADSQLINHIIAEIKQLSTMYWRKAVTRFNTYKIKAVFQYKKLLKLAQAYIAKASTALKQGKEMAMVAYKNPQATLQKIVKLTSNGLNKAEAMSIKVYNNPGKTYNQIVKVITRGIQILRKNIMNAYMQNAPIAKLMAQKFYTDLQQEMKSLQKQSLKAVMPYYQAILRIKNGEAPEKVLKPFLKQAQKLIAQTQTQIEKLSQKTKRAVCMSDRVFCRLVAQAFNVNKMVMDKYGAKVFNALMFAKVQSDRATRQTRVMLSNLGEKSSTLAAPTYQAVGMVFGKSHVVTFDQKYYDFIDYKAPDCTYVLARDFTDGKFTIMSQEGKIIVNTPGMTVQIAQDGKTKTTIGKRVTESLPVKSDSGVCMRYGDFIKCYFMEQKFKITVDLKHFAAVIGLSGWHHGKTQGLLGTNNKEVYDEWKMPDGKVTTDIYELANAYEVTQKTKCIAKPKTVRAPACNKRPSRRCEELFASKDSQFSRLFDKINPEAFLKACQADSSDCDSSFDYETAHCNATAAFVMYARAQWNYAAMPQDCNQYEGHKVGSSWVEKPLKRAVDVVVLVSERTTVGPVRNIFAKTVSNINLRLARTGYKNVRYALIGFGGHDVHEKAHIHPLNGKIFARLPALAKEIKTMPYSGAGQDTNDAYHAILKASSMKFRPGASRVFIMYNTVPHVSHEHGPTYDEAMHSLVNEANATLFVLDKLVFKNLKKHTIIGQSNGKMYTDDSTILPLPEVELPASEFKEMVKATNGGLFSNKIRKSKIQRFAQSMFKGMSVWLKKDSQLCKKCTLSKTWYGIPVPVCVATAC